MRVQGPAGLQGRTFLQLSSASKPQRGHGAQGNLVPTWNTASIVSHAGLGPGPVINAHQSMPGSVAPAEGSRHRWASAKEDLGPKIENKITSAEGQIAGFAIS